MSGPAASCIARTIDAIAFALAVFGGGALVLIACLITGEIISRALMSQSLPFAWEYSAYALGTLIFCGLGWTLRTGGHIRVTAALEFLPRRLSFSIEIVGAAIGTVLAALIAWGMIALCLQSYYDGTRSLLSWQTPLFIPQIPIALGAVGFALQMGLRVLLLCSNLQPDLKDARHDSAQSHL